MALVRLQNHVFKPFYKRFIRAHQNYGKIIIGIDISKDTLDYCTLSNRDVQAKNKGVLGNEHRAIEKGLKRFDKSNNVFALEHTGHCGAALINSLSNNGYTFYQINPLELKKSLGIRRGKSDAKDVCSMAEDAITNKHKPIPCFI